ncbi:phosphotransferase family protein [Mycobacterium sp.]|uniref:phosphotransferase family protein n=1 Tax=Mycobacterium sp. TaxID=1785 RepID=UPI00257B26DA|nr:phosphotransferase family protein [Mycobacterium sp.]
MRGPITIERVGFGQSNITSVVRDLDSREWVLREPPPGVRHGNAHDVHREARIITGLAGSDVPVARVVGTGRTRDAGIFFVMERVPGKPLESESDAEGLTAQQRYEVGIQLITTLARLHQIEPASLGLNVPRTPYVPRQIRRVSDAWLLVGSDSEHDAAWRAVRSRLLDVQPTWQHSSVIMHGDYRLSNVLVDAGVITAVLDWELCTIGDPMVDLAWLLDDWRSPADPAISMPSPTRAGGFPTRAEMVDCYARVTGFNTAGLDYYRGFTQWRAASLLQGVMVRRRSGRLGSHAALDLVQLDASIATLLASAAEHLEGRAC